MNNTLVKGLIITLITILATTFTTTGLPATVIGWEILSITTAGTLLVYLAKNFLFPSVSLFGTIDLRDLLSGLIMAVGSALSSLAASDITGTKVDWIHLLSLSGSIAVGYLAKKFVSGLAPASTTNLYNPPPPPKQ